MLTEIYIEALLVDEELADQAWEVWDDQVIPYLTDVQITTNGSLVTDSEM